MQVRDDALTPAAVAHMTAALKTAWEAVAQLVGPPVSIDWQEEMRVHLKSLRALVYLPGDLHVKRLHGLWFPYYFWKNVNGIEFFSVTARDDEETAFYLREATTDGVE